MSSSTLTKRRRELNSRNLRSVRLRKDATLSIEENILKHTIHRNVKISLDLITDSFNIREVRQNGAHWDSLVKRLDKCLDPCKVILVVQLGKKHNIRYETMKPF